MNDDTVRVTRERLAELELAERLLLDRAEHRLEVLRLAARAEWGALRWEDPLPVPSWVAEVRKALRAGLFEGCSDQLLRRREQLKARDGDEG